ncbi:MAG: hypothetical protein ACJAR2_000031 [Ilumatobacter sp.]|jgi:hypothetical protein
MPLDRGVALLDNPYTLNEIARFNDRLDALFAVRHDQFPRAYVTCGELRSSGVLSDVLTPGIRALVRSITPDAVIYHCLASETPARQRAPHVSASDVGGWHRDSDALDGLRSQTTDYYSLMIYLSDVETAENGAFEGALGERDQMAEAGMPTRLVTGGVGTAWLFDRCSLHRVHPNRSDVRRRLIKLSFQSNQLPNRHLDEGRFAHTLSAIDHDDRYLRFLFGDGHSPGHSDAALPEVAARAVKLVAPEPNAIYAITGKDRLAARYHRAAEHRWGTDLVVRKATGAARRVRRLITR